MAGGEDLAELADRYAAGGVFEDWKHLAQGETSQITASDGIGSL